LAFTCFTCFVWSRQLCTGCWVSIGSFCSIYRLKEWELGRLWQTTHVLIFLPNVQKGTATMATEILLEARSVLLANSNHQEPLSTFKPVVLEVSQHSLSLQRAVELVTVNCILQSSSINIKISQNPCDCVRQTIRYIIINPIKKSSTTPLPVQHVPLGGRWRSARSQNPGSGSSGGRPSPPKEGKVLRHDAASLS
jgi:hypothetical protein